MRYQLTFLETGEVVAEFEINGTSVKATSGRLAFVLTDEYIRYWWPIVRKDANAKWRWPKNETEVLRCIRRAFGRLYEVRPLLQP